ncbi:MAG: hypothetical protein JWQ97_572 [Phenylobacterium sp.]|nr:hypothetical protein [Phenylobacterium sp.]
MTEPRATHVVSSPEQGVRMRALPRDGVLQMLNLIRLRPLADYPPGHPDHAAGLTGAQAYARYEHESGPIFRRVGGRRIWVGVPELVVIGPDDQSWDMAVLTEYDSFEGFRQMQKDPAYQAAFQHRMAAVLDARVVRCRPAP